MADEPQYLTREGYEAIERRLKELIEVRRPQVAERLRQALEEGGELTENSEYEDAKNEQAFLEGEINRLEYILSSAEVLEDSDDHDVVRPGSRVTVVEKGTDIEEVYHLVGSAEANPREGKVSVVSPMGEALIGKRVGDRAKVNSPDGQIVFKIKSID